MLEQLNISEATFKYLSLLLVRGSLGLLYVICSGLFRRSFNVYFTGAIHRTLSACWTVVVLSQFHLNFYATRTLPNSFALCLIMVAYHYWFRKKYYHTVALFVFTTVVFRSEVLVLFAPVGLELLLRLPFWPLVLTGALSGFASIVFTILVDSYFWQRWLYPEGELLYFNTVLNKSHEWGTSPFYWYFVVAIPKTLMVNTLLLPVGLWCEWSRLKNLVIPVGVFVSLYSLLPHKELRFIFYVFPILNMVAALGLMHLWYRRQRKMVLMVLLVIVLGLLASSVASVGLGYISSKNYPGGEAIEILQKRADKEAKDYPFEVHLDVAACQQGISRFLEAHPRIRYDKSEELINFDHFTHRITDKKPMLHFEPALHSADFVDASRWTTLDTIFAFQRIQLSSSYPFVHVVSAPSLYIYKRSV